MTPARRAKDPRSFLPLTPRAFQVMLALAPGPLHGYALIQEVARLTDQLIVMRTGTLYLLVQRLRDQDLIEPTDERPPVEEDDERRQYYVLTDLGRTVLDAEVQRLRSVMASVRKQGLHWGKS